MLSWYVGSLRDIWMFLMYFSVNINFIEIQDICTQKYVRLYLVILENIQTIKNKHLNFKLIGLLLNLVKYLIVVGKTRLQNFFFFKKRRSYNLSKKGQNEEFQSLRVKLQIFKSCWDQGIKIEDYMESIKNCTTKGFKMTMKKLGDQNEKQSSAIVQHKFWKTGEICFVD